MGVLTHANSRLRPWARRHALAAFLTLSAAAAPVVGHAQDDAPSEMTAAEQERDEAARRHFRLGQAHYENGDFADAANEFEAAYEASQRPRLLYNAYVAYRDLQDTENAARMLRHYLDEVEDLGTAERAQLRRRLEALETAQENGSPPQTSARPETGPSSTGSTVPQRRSSGGFNPSPVGFIVAGAGLALGGAAVVTGILSSSEYDELDSRCPNGVCPDVQELRDRRDRGAALGLTTDVLWIGGAVAVATGLVLILVVQEDRPPDVALGGACTRDGCMASLGGTFQ